MEKKSSMREPYPNQKFTNSIEEQQIWLEVLRVIRRERIKVWH